jgi:hypothetical protein
MRVNVLLAVAAVVTGSWRTIGLTLFCALARVNRGEYGGGITAKNRL